MKRLLRISSGLFIYSIVPIACWFVLGITLGDKNVANVFSLTYPIQFIWLLFKTIFGTAANIKREKDKNENAVYSGIVMGTVLAAVIFGIFAIFIDPYIKFMNMDPAIYRDFALYSVFQLFIQVCFSFIIEKLLFEDKDKLANIHLFAFNIVNFVVLIGMSLITKNHLAIIVTTLIVLAIYVIALYIWQFKKFKFEWSLKKNFIYESASICSSIFMFLIYWLGLKNAFVAGPEYIEAINFVTLITDAQWDGVYAIKTVAKIDIAKDRFNYKTASKNGLFLTLIAICSSFVMFGALWPIYRVSLPIVLICMALEIIDFFVTTTYYNIEPFLQLKNSAFSNTAVSMLAYVIRFILSTFLLTAYCTTIGQVVAGLITLSMQLVLLFKNFSLKKDGTFRKNFHKKF